MPAKTKLPANPPARPAWAEALDDKEMLFVSAYLDTPNAAEAARAVGYAKSSSAVRGHDLRRRPHIAEAINKALVRRMGGPFQSRVPEEVSRLAFSNISDVLTIQDGQVIVKEHADLDRDTWSTIASIEEMINDKGYRTLRVKQHDRLAALTLLAKISGLMINRTELSGPGGGPVEVEHTDFRERITRRLDEMAKRVAAPTGQPIIDVTPARLRDTGARE